MVTSPKCGERREGERERERERSCVAQLPTGMKRLLQQDPGGIPSMLGVVKNLEATCLMSNVLA
jgi:hypothetical protein